MGDHISVGSSSQHLVVTPSTKAVAVVLTGPMGPGVGGGPGTGVPTFDDVVLKAGDTMEGFLVLNADPTGDFHAATKRWVEEYVAQNSSAATGPDTQGFTFFQSATPTATRIGDTWFDTSTGQPKTWDGFLWFPYALYPGGDTISGLLIASRNSTAGYVDGTGSLQVGSSGSSNLAFDHDRILARNGSGAAGPLHMYASEYTLHGGPVHIPTAPDASNDDSSGGLRIGPAGGGNIGIDGNEIAARNNNVSSSLYLNLEGGNVASGGVFTGRKQIVAEGGGEAIKVEAVGNNRPYIAVYGGTSTTRAMYLGYPSSSDNSVYVYADKGPLWLRSTNSVRSDTIYGDTANDWGVFIEANGTMGRAASTLRVKTNVEELTVEEASSILDLITWVRFNYIDKETGEAKDSLHFGAIAEWMDEAGLGKFVGYDDEGLPNAIRYNALWPLVARVQKSHEERLTRLESLIGE